MAKGLKRAWCILLSLFTLSFGISLKEAQEMALERHSSIRIQKLELERARKERLEKLGKFMPVINAELSFNLAKKQSFFLGLGSLPPREFIFQKGSYPKFTLQLLQELVNLRTIREYNLFKEKERVQGLTLKLERSRTLMKVREAYINALKAKALVETEEKHLELVSAHLSNVKELYKEGIVPLKDVLETKVKLHEVKERLSRARAQYRKSLNYLSYLISHEVVNAESINPERYLLLVNRKRKELLRAMEDKNPLLQLLRENIKLSGMKRELALSAFYPVAVLEAYYQRTEESDLFPKNRYLISFAFRWNIFSGMRKFRALEVSEIEKKKAIERYRDSLNQLRLQLENLLEEAHTLRERIELARVQLEDARENLKMAQEKYRAGIGTNTDVLDAQTYLITAQNLLRVAEYELLLTEFKLREVTGYE